MSAADIVILQSAPPGWPDWTRRCLASVATWAERAGVDYRLIGDELFDPVPAAWAAAAGPERLPLTDYARLLWIERLLAEGAGQVIWLDADILVVDPALAFPGGDFFCRELWLYRSSDDGLPHVRPSVNNCAMGFLKGSPLLDWYLTACRAAPDMAPLHRLALGPALLGARHAVAPLPLADSVLTLSPALMGALLGDNRGLLDGFRRLWDAPVGALHLCRSLGDTGDGPALVLPDVYDHLLDRLEAHSPF